MSSILSKLSSHLNFLSGDTTFLITLFILLCAFAFYFGRGFVVSLIISFYPASMFYKSFPFAEKVLFLKGEKLLLLNKLGLFLLFLIPITIIINRYIFSASEYDGSEKSLRTVGLAFALLVTIVLFSYTTVNYDVFHNYGTSVDALFTGSGREFYWGLAPIAILSVL